MIRCDGPGCSCLWAFSGLTCSLTKASLLAWYISSVLTCLQVLFGGPMLGCAFWVRRYWGSASVVALGLENGRMPMTVLSRPMAATGGMLRCYSHGLSWA